MGIIYRSNHGMKLDHLVFSLQYLPVRFAEAYDITDSGESDTDIVPISWGGNDWFVPMERLVPTSMRWGSCGDLSTLSFRVALGAGQGYSQESPETAPATTGISGWLVRMIDQEANEWFRGIVGIDQMVIQADPAHESLSYVAYGPELRLRNRAVSGQWRKNTTVDDSEIGGSLSNGARTSTFRYWPGKCVFNEKGLPNASASDWSLTTEEPDGYPCKVFESSNRNAGSAIAQYWTAYTALRSLIEYFDDYRTISRKHTDWDAIEKLLESDKDTDAPLPEVDVEGMDLLEAINKVLASVGYGFSLAPWAAEDEGSKHKLHVFSLKNPARWISPWLVPKDTSLDSREGRNAEVKRLHYVRDAHNVQNDVRLIGDVKRKQVIFAYSPSSSDLLQPYWDTSIGAYSLEDWADSEHRIGGNNWADDAVFTSRVFATYFGKWTSAPNEQFGWGNESSYHYWRSFALNEDGALCPTITSTPDLSDLVGDWEGNWVRRPRRLGPSFTYDADGTEGRIVPAHVELGVADNEGTGTAWIQVPAHIWPDRIGFTISVRDIINWRPYAKDEALKNTYPETYLTLLNNTMRGGGTHRLMLRLIGSIETDDVLGSHWKRDENSSWPMIAERTQRDARFKYRTIADSISSNATTDTANDVVQCKAIAYRLREICEDQIGHGSIIVPFITRSFQPGVGIPGTRGRAVNFYLDATRSSVRPAITQVIWRFEENNTTELLLETSALRISR